MLPVDVAVALNPDMEPWVGNEMIVHVSVWPTSRSSVASNELKMVLDRFWQAVKPWLAPPVKDGAWFGNAPKQKTLYKIQKIPNAAEKMIDVFIR